MDASQRKDAPARSTGRNLPVAILSGLVLAGLFIGSLVVHPLAFLAFIGVLALIALAELDGAMRSQGLRPATPVAAGAGAVMIIGAHTTGASAQSLGLVLLTIGGLVWTLVDSASSRTATGHEGRSQAAGSVGATFLMGLWVPFLVSFLGLLLVREHGVWLVMATVALSVTSDIGAYAWGSVLGRHKLAPSVSPSKTWEGTIGGVVTALVVAAGITAPFVPGLDLVASLALAGGVAVASILGDLTESLVKRDLGVKDLGRIIPGHGGIMDRADAVIFALPAAHLILLALGV
jgi:phosphatidate cytidylyltransferase